MRCHRRSKTQPGQLVGSVTGSVPAVQRPFCGVPIEELADDQRRHVDRVNNVGEQRTWVNGWADAMGG